MTDRDHEVYERIARAVEALANKMLAQAKLTPKGEEAVRTLLNENVRYWK